MNLISDRIVPSTKNFLSFKKTLLKQSNVLEISNKKAYQFLINKPKVLSAKQQNIGCKNLHLSFGAIG